MKDEEKKTRLKYNINYYPNIQEIKLHNKF